YVVLLSLRPTAIRRLVAAAPSARFLAVAIREEEVDMRTGDRPEPASRRDAAVIAAALVVIVLGSIGMVQAATDLGERWGGSDVVVGTLVLAALTSLPNLLTAVRLALRGRGAATVSEAFNSNSLNVIFGIAVPALVLSLGAAGGLVTFSMWWLLGMTAVAVVFAYIGHGVRRVEGAVVILLYVAFAVVVASRSARTTSLPGFRWRSSPTSSQVCGATSRAASLAGRRSSRCTAVARPASARTSPTTQTNTSGSSAPAPSTTSPGRTRSTPIRSSSGRS